MSRAVLLLSVLSLFVFGCEPNRVPPEDTGFRDTPDAGSPGEDAPLDDAPLPTDDVPGLDAGTDAGIDGGMTTTGSTPAPPADIVRMGTNRAHLLLRGTVLAPSGVINAGEVLIDGNMIACVATDCSAAAAAADATIIDTHSVISPGLINGHDHITYDFLPEWVPDPPMLFSSRYAWRADDEYSAHIRPEASAGTAGSFVCPASKWAELRSIIHGTTTIQGQSPEQRCIDRLVRNADHFHGLGPDHLQTNISGACEAGLSDAVRGPLITNFTAGTTTRYAIHMAEGVSGGGVSTMVTQELDCYAGRARASISLFAPASGPPWGTALFIHAVPFDVGDIMEAVDNEAQFIWSPSSNIILYGTTAPIEEMLAFGAIVGLGPDWTVSGSDEMLSEMRFAHEYGLAEGIDVLTPQMIHQMATADGAEALGLGPHIGSLAVGFRADISVFGRVGGDPYQAVLDSRAADVRLVMIDGVGYYGDLALEVATSANGDCDMLDACGSPKYLCVANTPGPLTDTRRGETLGDIEAQLRAHLAAGWDHDDDPGTPNQAFVVGPDQLQPLVDCSL